MTSGRRTHYDRTPTVGHYEEVYLTRRSQGGKIDCHFEWRGRVGDGIDYRNQSSL